MVLQNRIMFIVFKAFCEATLYCAKVSPHDTINLRMSDRVSHMSALKIGDKNDATITFAERAKAIERQKNAETTAATNAQKSPFTAQGFFQVNIQQGAYLRKLLIEQPLASWIFSLFADHMDGLNAIICPYETLCAISGKSRASVARAIQYLKVNGYISSKKIGAATVYLINNNLIWKSYGYSHNNCEFRDYCSIDVENIMAKCRAKEPKSHRRNGILELPIKGVKDE